MQLAWFHWWWDPIGLDRAQVVLGVLGLIAALAAVIYAWVVAKRQFKLMNEQGAIVDRQTAFMKEQTEIERRLEALAAEQKTTLKRLGEISERQFRIMEDQMARRPALRVQTGTMHRIYKGTVVPLYIHNDGNGTAHDCRWEMIVEADAINNLELRNPNDSVPAKTMVPGTHLWMFGAIVASPVYPKRSLHFATMTYDPKLTPTNNIVLRFQLVAEQGVWPANGNYVLTLSRQGEGTEVAAFYRTDDEGWP